MTVKYAEWKKVLWRYVRVFVSASLAQIGVNLVLIGDPDLVRSAIIAAIAAGLSAISKALREGENYRAKIHKLPI